MPRKHDVDVSVGVSGAGDTKRKLREVSGGALGLGDNFKRAGKKTKEAGQQIKAAGEKTSGLNSVLGRFKSVISGLIIGTFSIGSLTKMYAAWREEITQTAGAQKELAQATELVENKVKELANQMGQMTRKGMPATRDILNKFMLAGPALDEAAATALAISTHSTFGERGQLLGGKALGLGEEVAAFSSMMGLKGLEPGQTVKVLRQFKAFDRQAAQKRLSQIAATQKQALTFNFGGFISGLSTLAPRAIAMGATPEDVLATYGAAIGITGTEQEAAMLDKQINMLLAKPDVLLAAATEAGLTLDELMAAPFMTRKMAIAAWLAKGAATVAGQKQLQEVLMPREMQRAQALFTPGGILDIQRSREALATTGVAFYPEQLAKWRKTEKYKRTLLRQQTRIRATTVSPRILMGQAQMEAGAEAFRQAKRAGRGRWWKPDRPGFMAVITGQVPESIEFGDRALLKERLQAIVDDPNATPARRKAAQIEINNMRISLSARAAPVTPEEIGRWVERIERLEMPDPTPPAISEPVPLADEIIPSADEPIPPQSRLDSHDVNINYYFGGRTADMTNRRQMVS